MWISLANCGWLSASVLRRLSRSRSRDSLVDSGVD